MRIFVYEFVTGGGWSAVFDHPPPSSLATEGRAMRDALRADLEATGSIDVLTLDDRLPERDAFEQAARRADATVIIAPEFDEILATRHRWAAAVGARVLGCGLKTIELAADKQRSAEHLARHGLNVPEGRFLAAGQPLPRDFAYPAVLKPVDGAGSLGIRWIGGPDDLVATPPAGRGWRLERFCPGLAASVALLCGPHHVEALPACQQFLAGAAAAQASPPQFLAGEAAAPAPFAYRGGQLPLPPPLDARARRLGREVARALFRGTPDGPLGWLGIDLVLGSDPGGADDVVIEINPRLTTSYLGLRRLARDNLAAALLAVARGEPAQLSFRAEPLQFAPDGCVTQTAAECADPGQRYS
jgi:predicted ATP-grasp superfamily ATP-dependent carboligase